MSFPENEVTVSRRPLDVEDYIDVVRRHKAWILGPTFAGLVIAVVVAFLMPDTYESVARMRIAPQSVPEQLVPSTVTIRLDQRLQGLRTTILSRTNLGALITDPKLDLYKKMRARYPLDDAVEKMAKDV